MPTSTHSCPALRYQSVVHLHRQVMRCLELSSNLRAQKGCTVVLELWALGLARHIDAVFTPMDMVKQRLQLSSSAYIGVWDCVRRVLREEGIRAFYASYRIIVIMNAPFTVVYFTTYEVAKKGLIEISPASASDERLVVHATTGAAAEALAAAITTPLDVPQKNMLFRASRSLRASNRICSLRALENMLFRASRSLRALKEYALLELHALLELLEEYALLELC
ncbi:unnamed protein product [Fraxinus pennsylvanica]|uniref:Uncharacterized protein n=1 Tax=Fraxinus pennsylvanica TaxID=56036 RepID=A0AAD1YX36_9LAMI|nr:unnamed protein product [Fraxinus pennsylvanica]